MRFSGSAVSAGEVQNIVTSSVLKQNIDYFFWPAIAGEQFPPALGSGSGYTSRLGQPAYQLDATQSSATVTTVVIPRVGLNGKQNVALSWQWAFHYDGSQSQPITLTVGDSNNKVFFSVVANGITNVISIIITTHDSNGTQHQQTFNNVATITQNILGDSFPTQISPFTPFEIDITAAGVITVKINGVVVATSTTTSWPAVFTNSHQASSLQMQWAIIGAQTAFGQSYANTILASWT